MAGLLWEAMDRRWSESNPTYDEGRGFW
jgi:hypothetical protein